METRSAAIYAARVVGFKSYYVVWKHSDIAFNLSALLRFKSYYVVWKLYFFDRTVQYVFCLNRTM